MNIKQEIIDAIKIVVDSAIRKSCPQIMFGVVIAVGNSKKCTVRINQIDYELSYYGDTAPTINQKYPVFIPFGKMNLAFILTSGSGGGSGGTSDYNQLSNRPAINNIVLSGNRTPSQLGLFDGDYDSLSNKPIIPSSTSQLTNDSDFITNAEVDALKIGRVSVKGYRYHVDRINGNDDDTGYSGHAWKTLDRFFDEANRLTGNTGDIRCYLDSPGTYIVGSSSEESKTFTGMAIHITGGTSIPSSYDGGNYVISFQNTGETKFYESHLNLQNVKVLCPNSTVTNPFAFDGGGYSINYSEIVPQLSIFGCTAIVTDTICKNISISSSKVILNSVKTTATTGNQITISNGSDVTYTGSISTGNLLATNTSAAFKCTNSRLCLTQAYPSTLNTPSLYIANSNIVISKARISSWLAKIDTADTNSVWSISATYVGGDSYSCSSAILPVIFTGGAKSIHFSVPLPKEISASSVTVNTLKGAIRMPLGGYLSDGSTASSASDWLNGTNIASISANIVGNVIYIAIVCTDIPTYGGTAITNNSCAVFEGSINVTFG